MKPTPLPSLQYLRECFTLNAACGLLIWKARPLSHFPSSRQMLNHHSRFAGKVAGNFSMRDGRLYSQINMGGRRFGTHRIIYAMANEVEDLGDLLIDHEDGDTTNNRPSNLRLTDSVGNGQNMAKTTLNVSGRTGVSWCQGKQKWYASIRVNGRTKSLGLFEDFDLAVKARKRAELSFGFHPNHGRDQTGTLEAGA